MNGNTQHLPVTIAAAGARVRALTPHISDLWYAAMRGSEEVQIEARGSPAILDAEDEALRTYITAIPATSPEEALAQIDVVALKAQAMATDGNLDPDYRDLAARILRVLISAAGVLSDVSSLGLNDFTATGLDQTYSLTFPLAARSAFAASTLL